MFLNYKNRKNSVIYSWIVSYILILAIMVVAISAIYYVARHTIKNEIKSSNELLIGNLKDNMDNTIRNVERFSMEVAYNQDIQNVISVDERDEGLLQYTLYKASGELRKYKIMDSSLKEYYIYFSELDVVITPKTVYSQDSYFDWYLNTGDNTIDEWLEIMNQKHRGDYLVMPYSDDTQSDKKTVGLVRSFPFPTDENQVVILLDSSALLSSGIDESGERLLLIMDKNNNIIASTGIEDELPGINYKDLRDEHGSINASIDDRNVVVSYTSSQSNDWKFIIITPEDVFWRKSEFLGSIMAGGMLFSILIGVMISYFYLRKNYNPLKDVVRYFQENMHSSLELKSNEYGYIRQAFNETLEEKQTIQRKLDQQNEVLKSNFIESILKGKHHSVPIYELMTTYNIRFKYDHYTVMVAYIGSMNEELWEDENGESIDQYSLSQFVSSNVIKELVNCKHIGYITEVDDMLVCLINMNSNGKEYQNELLKVANEARKVIKGEYNVHIDFAIGGLHTNLEGVPKAYSEAMNAMEYSKVMGVEQVVFYDDVIRETVNSYYYPIEQEYQLINCIESADYEAAANIFEEVFQKNYVDSTPSLDIAQCLMFDMISTVLKAVDGLGQLEGRSYFDSTNPIAEVMQCRTLLEMKDKMLKILESACEYFEKQNSQTDYSIRDKVIDIIDNNFKDSNLSIASIAEQVDKHPYYVSRLFKKQTGEGILDYINKVRVDKAKALLKENTDNQEEIAEKIGYTNVRTFQRAFKKHEGITPGKLKIK